ncbi:MAG: hypothetical protein R3B13_05870 [Polyangiaceae bacterium]
MKFRNIGVTAVFGLACVMSACASESDSPLGTGGSGNFGTGAFVGSGGFGTGGFGTGGFGTGGFGTGGGVATGGFGAGGVGTGGLGTGGVATGGASGAGTGGVSTGGVGTGGVSTGGTSGSGGASAGSCVGNCGFDDNMLCYCDSSCKTFGDCCSDFDAVCGGTGGSGTGGAGTGGVGTGGVGTGGVGTGGVGTGGVGTGGVGTGGAGTGGAGTGGVTGNCQNAEECANPATMVCSPTTQKCTAGECTAQTTCPNNQACLAQVASAVVGACYPPCTPYASSTGCTSGSDCVPYLFDASEGACFKQGTTADGAQCTDTDLGTGCVKDSLCVRDAGVRVCRRQCNFFASSPACVASQRCALGGVCIAEGGDSAAIGAACSVSSIAGEICGNDGKAWRGTCQDVGSGLRCYKVCRTSTASDCSAGQTCSPFQGDNTAGVCF